MSESVIFDARFPWVVGLSSLRTSSRFLNIHSISPWPRPWTLTSPSEKTPHFVLKKMGPLLCFLCVDAAWRQGENHKILNH